MQSSRLLSVLLLLLAALALPAACAPATAGGGSEASARGRSNVITRAELEANGSLDLYEVVQRLRPQWLTGRPPRDWQGSAPPVVVYLNQALQGEVGSLRSMQARSAQRLRFVDGATASASLPGLGSRQVAGAIIIETTSP